MRHVWRLAVLGTMLVLSVSMTTGSATSATSPKMCDGQVATVVGTSGDDNLTDTNGSTPDVVWLGPGNDTWTSAPGSADIVCGGKGHDHLYGGDSAALLIGGPGGDYFAELGADTIAQGGLGNDDFEQLTGTSYGGRGDDTFTVRGGVYYGGPGHDYFDMQKGASGAIHGQSGKDEAIFFGRGLHVNLTHGTAYWNTGTITLDGIRIVDGTRYADVLIGSPRADVLDGGQGNDLIKGRAGNDDLGTQYSDGGTIYGGPGYDTCTAPHTYGCEKVW